MKYEIRLTCICIYTRFP